MASRYKLYEINTRVFLKKYFGADSQATVADIPDSFWKSLTNLGINAVWMMGVWETTPELIQDCCFSEGLIQSYNRSLRDWQPEDVIGSPYAINQYKFNANLGSEADFKALRSTLEQHGMKLILDFIPNHLSARSVHLQAQPDLFVQASEEQYRSDTHTLFKSPFDNEHYFAHGRDPFFPAWTDTVQLNYENPSTRIFMFEQLMYIGQFCDGIRCDMAMLILNNVFQNTWAGLLHDAGFERPSTDFWQDAIPKIKAAFPEIIFIAEAYWDLEWTLQQQGFDFTYDKRLLDRLKNAPVSSIKAHLTADLEYQEKSVRFIENHDEERAMVSLGREKALASTVIIGTIPGMTFYHDGQLQGKRHKLPVQLGREPNENLQPVIADTYSRLLQILNTSIINQGSWTLLETVRSWPTNAHAENMFAWEWQLNSERLLVIINFSANPGQCRVPLTLSGYDELFTLRDLWTGTDYLRSAEEAQHSGLFVDLGPWQFHLFQY